MKPWKVQKFFGDIVYDLRSRGLLPVVILLVVALVAVPILVSRGSSDSPAPAIQPAAGDTASAASEVESAVVTYVPGVRDYKKRLDDLSAKDPFRQPPGSSPSVAAASQLSSTVATPSGSAGSTGTASSTSTSTGTSAGTGTHATPGTTTPPRTTHRLYLYRAVADISVGDASQPLERHKHLKAFTALPNQVTPAMVYLGSSLNQKRAYFSLSKSVNQFSGPGSCVPSPTDCSLLALGPGQTEDVVYSVDGKTYRVKVNKISLNRVAVKD